MAIATTAAAVRKTKRYKAVRDSLLDQLQRRGSDQPHFLELIEDYMALYTAAKLAAADVAERGVTIFGVGSAGQETAKRNDSVDMLIKANAQMLKILAELKLTVDDSAGEDDDEL